MLYDRCAGGGYADDDEARIRTGRSRAHSWLSTATISPRAFAHHISSTRKTCGAFARVTWTSCASDWRTGVPLLSQLAHACSQQQRRARACSRSVPVHQTHVRALTCGRLCSGSVPRAGTRPRTTLVVRRPQSLATIISTNSQNTRVDTHADRLGPSFRAAFVRAMVLTLAAPASILLACRRHRVARSKMHYDLRRRTFVASITCPRAEVLAHRRLGSTATNDAVPLPGCLLFRPAFLVPLIHHLTVPVLLESVVALQSYSCWDGMRVTTRL